MSAPVRNAALYLPEVEAHHEAGPYKTLIDDARAKDAEYSKIWDLFAFKNQVTVHLARFTQGVLRTPATITPALRELIAAYTSYQNECAFCTKAHAAAASELFGDEQLVWSVLGNLDSSPLDDQHKALFRFVTKVTRNLAAVEAADIETLHAAGWNDEAIYFAITTCALFNFYNRWITATGVPEMSPEAHRAQGKSLASRGYGRE